MCGRAVVGLVGHALESWNHLCFCSLRHEIFFLFFLSFLLPSFLSFFLLMKLPTKLKILFILAAAQEDE